MAACRVTSMVASWVARKTATTLTAAAAASATIRCLGTATKLATAEATAAAEATAPSTAAAASKPAVRDLSDTAVLHLLKSGLLSPHRLEADLSDATRAVTLRRAFVADALSKAVGPAKTSVNPTAALASLPSGAFDSDAFYRSILNTNCEAVIGCVGREGGRRGRGGCWWGACVLRWLTWSGWSRCPHRRIDAVHPACGELACCSPPLRRINTAALTHGHDAAHPSGASRCPSDQLLAARRSGDSHVAGR
jgi:hypothetical protein